jgi:hypothetical protein
MALQRSKAEMAHSEGKTGALDAEDRMLVLVRDELYEGRWDLMRLDLLDRLHGKPHIFKLVNRIQDDLARIDRLEQIDAEIAMPALH